MTVTTPGKLAIFELVGDEIDGDGMSLDEAYAFLTGADRLTSEAPRVVVAAATAVRIPRVVLPARDQRSDGEVVTAAAEVHTGAMIALIPATEDAHRLALDGFEEPEQLHVTLVYLGDAADLDAEARAAILDVVRRYATVTPGVVTAASDHWENQPRDSEGQWTSSGGGSIDFSSLDLNDFKHGQVIARGAGDGMKYEVSFDDTDDSRPFAVNMMMPNGVTVPLKTADPGSFGDVDWKLIPPGEFIEQPVKSTVKTVSTGLTVDERQVVAGYLTELGNRQFNDSLRRGEGINEWAIDLLDSAINKHKTTRETVVYRGVSLPHGRQLDVGDTFTDPAYTSVTDDIDLAREFAHLRATGKSDKLNTSFVEKVDGVPVVMEITVPSGIGLMPGDVTVKERVLARGRRLRVVGKRADGTLQVRVLA